MLASYGYNSRPIWKGGREPDSYEKATAEHRESKAKLHAMKAPAVEPCLRTEEETRGRLGHDAPRAEPLSLDCEGRPPA